MTAPDDDIYIYIHICQRTSRVRHSFDDPEADFDFSDSDHSVSSQPRVCDRLTSSVAEPSSHSSSSIVPLAPVSNLEEVSHHNFKHDASDLNRWSGSRDESFGSDSSVSHELRPVMHSCVRPISPSPVRPVVKRQRIAFTGGTMDDIDARWYQDAADLSPASLPIEQEVVVPAPAMVEPTNTPRVLARYNTEEAVAMAFADQ